MLEVDSLLFSSVSILILILCRVGSEDGSLPLGKHHWVHWQGVLPCAVYERQLCLASSFSHLFLVLHALYMSAVRMFSGRADVIMKLLRNTEGAIVLSGTRLVAAQLSLWFDFAQLQQHFRYWQDKPNKICALVIGLRVTGTFLHRWSQIMRSLFAI